jgi:hypothetical protein
MNNYSEFFKLLVCIWIDHLKGKSYLMSILDHTWHTDFQ